MVQQKKRAMLTTSLSCQTPYTALMSLLSVALSSDMEKQIYDTKYSVDCQYSIRAVALLNPDGAIAQFQRNDCSIPPVEVIW